MKLRTLSENEIFITFTALALLLLSAYICGRLMEKINAPKVVGESVGGMLFGGTLLCHFFPEHISGIFNGFAEEGKVLNLFYQLD